MHVVIFEGSVWRSFAPFSLSRPVFALRCGMSTLLEKQVRATNPTRLTLWVRPELADFCKRELLPTLRCPVQINTPLDNEPALILSGRTLHVSKLEVEEEESIWLDAGPHAHNIVRQAYVKSPGLSHEDVMKRSDRWLRLQDLPKMQHDQARLPEYVWDLIKWNEDAILADAFALEEKSQAMPTGPYHLVNESDVWLGKDVKLAPGCVLDASKGPVVLGERVTVGANAVVEGPCAMGPHSIISPLSTIRSGTSTGPACKLGGEVTSSILISHSNKPHEGFLGDSYLGQWVNLGAGSNTSNLKNTYGTVQMPVAGSRVDTGRRFLGSLIGDHSRIAIGTRMMTGSYVGYSCVVGTPVYPPRFIPSFTFLTEAGPTPYRIDKLAETQKAVFARRNREWSDEVDGAMNRYVASVAPGVEKEAE